MSKSPRSNSYEDYWKEFNDIASGTDGENEEEESTKTPDEGEEEAAWLKDAGYEFVVSHITGGRELTDEEIQGFTATLTTSQAAVVRRRVNSLSATFRAKQKHKIDVRDIFPEQTDSQSGRPSAPHNTPNSTDDVTGNVVHRRTMDKKLPSLLKPKGEYSMSGRRNEVLKDTNTPGIEMLSMQPKGTFNKYMGPSSPEDHGRTLCAMPSISDEDIEFELRLEETAKTKNTMQTAGLESEDELPNFRVVSDKLGLTTASDLSDADMNQIKSLALIELTSLLEKHNIIYHRQKGKKKAKENGIFGVPLQTLLDHDQKTKPNQTVPLVFEDMIKYMEQHCLEHEGVLRIPGSTARVKQLRKDLEDKFYMEEFSWDDVLPHDVAALMKQFLRELPHPLLSHEYIEAFAQIENIKERKNQLRALNLLILLLPHVNRNTLKLLLELLLKITQRRQKNLMGLSNVAMIMAPNLFLSPSSRSKTKAIRDMEISMAAGTSNIVMMLIKYQKIIWTVPSTLLQQMRHQNDMENQKKAREKSIIKFLRKDKSDIYKKPAIANEGDFVDGVIRVQAPCLTKSCAAVKLYEETTACDIIDKFRSSNLTNNGKNKKRKDNTAQGISNFAETDAHLFEVGGNIGERCLHPQTNMLALYQINPNAEWIIRSETAD
ncbi:rho GTPase-activating protein 18-like [Ostrea edulis]|uniref:rho GTPase-activating protein 18-like n=1 Tax=Ostrea edulis TaxID=37623 RepID=UPI0024AEBBF5|nr:rho GTPase-activating protein 18-like [Ostrea edulis]XP_055997360.1 rho GTPase-activating protein 18-like [Ostrea edulis]XP_055997361.1 rho GTPase-activating protein 18-like [Ostrea edulis]XP_055997362.1 rho GTPase-activating protein 18-like [Ostrea edulis]